MDEPDRPESVAQLAEVYLGNILYALEATALWLEEQQRADDAAFYRGIARRLADARGKERGVSPRLDADP